MNQTAASHRAPAANAPYRVTAPHSYDGIGQALRAAFRDHREPPGTITSVLGRLDSID